MDPQKLAFLTALMNDAQKQNKDNLMPFIMAAASRANSEGMNVSDEETDLIYQEMKRSLKPEDQARVEMVYQMMRKNKRPKT